MNKNIILRAGIAGCFLAGMSVLCLTGCVSSTFAPKNSDPIQRTDFLLNTFVDIKIYDSDDTTILDDAMAICKDYESRFSRTIETSEIYELNHRTPDQQTSELSDDTAELLENALHYCELSDGAFDITIEPVSSLWDFTSGEAVIPDESAISSAVQHVGYENLVLDGNTLTFLSPDTTLDLGAIAKGYAVERVARMLEERGISGFVINVGGNVRTVGTKPGGELWLAGIENPVPDAEEPYVAYLGLAGESIVTSGSYQRFYIVDGKNYHHIIDAETLLPADRYLSVSIVCKDSALGDALSTALFCMTPEDGLALIESIPDAEALWIMTDESRQQSSGFVSYLTEP